MKKVILISFLAVGLSLTSVSHAHRGGGWHGGGWHGGPRVGIGIGLGGYYGDPFWGPGYYGPGPYWGPAYYAPPPVVIQPQPDVYVQQPTTVQPVTTGRYWCTDPAGYYPQVPACPSGWTDTQQPVPRQAP